MGRKPCCEKIGLNKGKWTAEEDEKLASYIKANGEGSWRSLPKNAGLLRCGKSCRLRWINYLKADVKRGNFTEQEEETIVKLHKTLGNRWSVIASQLPGRTDNEIKNYWNTRLSRTIYKYRFIGEATLTQADMIKTAPKNTNRANKNAASPAEQPSSSDEQHVPNAAKERDDEEKSDSVSTSSTKGWPDAQGMNEMLGPWTEIDDDILMHLNNFLEHENTNQCHNDGDGFSIFDTTSTKEWLDALILSPNDAQGTEETLEPWSEIDDDILMHLNYFLQGEETAQCHNDGDGFMANMAATEERDRGGDGDGGWSSNSDTASLYEGLSPIVSYFNDDVLQSDHNGARPAMGELGLWNEEGQYLDLFIES